MQFLRKCLHPSEIAQVQRLAAVPSPSRSAAPSFAVSAASPAASSQLPSAQLESVSRFLASRWAAKEALTKAAGKRLLFPDMCVERDMTLGAEDPRARLSLSGEALAWSASRGLEPAPLLSLSHDGEYAVAFVCLQRLGEAQPQPQQQQVQQGGLRGVMNT